MTEYDLFVHSIPVIEELIVDSRQLTPEEYQGWKQWVLSIAPENVKSFVGKVLCVIDKYR